MNVSHDFPTIDYIYNCTEATPEKILPVDQRFYCPDNVDIKNKGVDIYSAAVSKMVRGITNLPLFHYRATEIALTCKESFGETGHN